MRYAICVSGAHSGETLKNDRGQAFAIGKAIAEEGHIITTGATVGLPFYAALGAKKSNGLSVGFSPASSMNEHVNKYRLPIGVYDFVSYTGMHYVGRDAFLVQSSDAVITVGGGFGTLHEFTTALESHTLCGVLLGSGGTADMIPELLEKLEPPHRSRVVFDTDPKTLVKKLLKLLDAEYSHIDAANIAREWLTKDYHGDHAG